MQKTLPTNSNPNNPAQHQNISINISYNLNTHKIPKSILPHKKTSKNKKNTPPTRLQAIGNQFFNNIPFNPSNQGKKIIKKQNPTKKYNQSLQQKQPKTLQQQKPNLKKKKNINTIKQPFNTLKQPFNTIKQPSSIPQASIQVSDNISDYYNPFAQNSKNFLKRNIQSPDIFKIDNQRKLKTQGSMYEPVGEGISTGTKKKKHSNNFRQQYGGLLSKNVKANNFIRESVGSNLIGKLPSSFKTMLKKTLSNTKTPKNKTRQSNLKQKQKRVHTQQNENFINPNHQLPSRHNNSCMLYSTKKNHQNYIITEPNLLQTAQNIISQYISVNSTKARKRAQSAYIFGRRDKQLVSKLLNMSVISSQLGSSQLISSERMKSGRNDLTRKKLGLKVDELDQPFAYHLDAEINQRQVNKLKNARKDDENLPGNALRQYLNSIDLRIIKSIESDTANIAINYDQTHKSNQQIKLNEEKNKIEEEKIENKFFKPKTIQSKDKNRQEIAFSSKIKDSLIEKSSNLGKSSQEDIVSFYNNLFSKALQNKLQQQQQKYIESAELSQIKNHSMESNGSIKLKKEKFEIKGFNESQSSDGIDNSRRQRSDIDDEKNISEREDRRDKIDVDEKEEEEESESERECFQFVKSKGEKKDSGMKLNFQHYKQLLNRTEKQTKEKQLKHKFNFNLIQCNSSEPQTNITHISSITHQSETPQFYKAKQSYLSSQFHQKNKISLLEQSPDSIQSLSYLKQEQIQRWNMNKMFENHIQKEQLNLKQTKSKSKENQKQQQHKQNQKYQKQKQQQQKKRSEIQIQHQNQPQSLNKEKPLSPPLKSPKHSNRQKPTTIEPQYNQVCWQYNSQQLEQQLNNKHSSILQHKQHFFDSKNQKHQQKNTNNINNSPNNYSQDGLGSGDDQYDSKKYSSTQAYAETDIVLEIFDSSKDQETQNYKHTKNKAKNDESEQNLTSKSTNKKLTKQHLPDNNSSYDDLEEEHQLSYEQREINCSERWVNPTFATKQDQYQDSNQQMNNERVKLESIVTGNCEINNQHSNHNYLECSLEEFGVLNINSSEKNTQSQTTKQPTRKDHSQTAMQNSFAQLTQTLTKNDSSPQSHTTTFKLSINGRQTTEEISLINETEKKDTFSQIRRKRLSNIVEDIILELIRQFARDISYILKKSSHDKRTQQQFDQNSSPFRSYKQHSEEENDMLSPYSKSEEEMFQIVDQESNRQKQKQLTKKSQFVGKCFGIDTSFSSVQRYLKEFKEYLLKDHTIKQAIIKNINKDIGPNSLEILSYLRPEYDGSSSNINQLTDKLNQNQNQEEPLEDEEDGLFVVPSEAFSEFQNFLENQLEGHNKLLQPERQIIFTQKQKRNTNFWHRGIYESWNQFLDFERPYGINGKPYEWIQEKKKFRQVHLTEIDLKLQKGIDKLLQAISLPSGLIYDKFDLSPIYSDLSEEQKIYLNEQRLSRMLAIELFQSQQTWINYNDQMAELLVQLSRVIEERIFFEMATQVKKIARKRKLILAENTLDQYFPRIEDRFQESVNDRQYLCDEVSDGQRE